MRPPCPRGSQVSASVPHRLVIADDHPLFRFALREVVTGLFERGDIAEADCFDELDLTMLGVRGFSGLIYMRAQYPRVPVVIVSANHDPAVIRRCMDFGASGFIPKTFRIDQFPQGDRSGAQGRHLDLAAEGDDDNSAMLAQPVSSRRRYAARADRLSHHDFNLAHSGGCPIVTIVRGDCHQAGFGSIRPLPCTTRETEGEAG